VSHLTISCPCIDFVCRSFLKTTSDLVQERLMQRTSPTWNEFLREVVRNPSSLLKLMLSHRWMFKFLKDEPHITSGMLPAYQDYVTRTSSEDMAISLRLAGLLAFVCKQLHPGVVIDLGSGFSSYALRMAAKTLPNTVIYSVDADLKWLEATRLFLSRQAVSTDGLYTLGDFRQANQEKGDLIVFDILHTGDGTRAAVLKDLILWTKPSSLVIVDDMHKSRFRRSVVEWTKRHHLKFIDLGPMTKDTFSRFASLVYGFPRSGC
jgi:hypothetical protein